MQLGLMLKNPVIHVDLEKPNRQNTLEPTIGSGSSRKDQLPGTRSSENAHLRTGNHSSQIVHDFQVQGPLGRPKSATSQYND